VMATDPEKKRQRRARWDDRRRRQLGFVNNLFLGLAVGAVAFELNQLLSHPAFADRGLTAAVWSVVLASASAIGGLLTSITRLLDFRATAAIHGASSTEEEMCCRSRANLFSRITWMLLWFPITGFALALVFGVRWVWVVLASEHGSLPV